VKAIRMVAEGKKFFSPACVEKYALELRLGSEPSPHERLSSREYQVMHLIATGKTAKEIASELSLSVKTISTFRSHILEKMSLGSNAEIIRYAIDHRLIY